MANGAIEFECLPAADLVIDALYRGEPQERGSGYPVPTGPRLRNLGGFRPEGRRRDHRAFLLFSTGEEQDWPDRLDRSTRTFTYYGDNRTAGVAIGATPRNRMLMDVFGALHRSPPSRQSIPPVPNTPSGSSRCRR